MMSLVYEQMIIRAVFNSLLIRNLTANYTNTNIILVEATLLCGVLWFFFFFFRLLAVSSSFFFGVYRPSRGLSCGCVVVVSAWWRQGQVSGITYSRAQALQPLSSLVSSHPVVVDKAPTAARATARLHRGWMNFMTEEFSHTETNRCALGLWTVYFWVRSDPRPLYF